MPPNSQNTRIENHQVGADEEQSVHFESKLQNADTGEVVTVVFDVTGFTDPDNLLKATLDFAEITIKATVAAKIGLPPDALVDMPVELLAKALAGVEPKASALLGAPSGADAAERSSGDRMDEELRQLLNLDN